MLPRLCPELLHSIDTRYADAQEPSAGSVSPAPGMARGGLCVPGGRNSVPTGKAVGTALATASSSRAK